MPTVDRLFARAALGAALVLVARVACAQPPPPAVATTPALAALGAAPAADWFAAADTAPIAAAPRADDDRDRRFHLVLGAYLTAAGSDVAVSMYQMGRGVAHEAGFGRWWQERPVAFAVTKSAMTAVFAYGLQRLHQNRPKTAVAVGLLATAIEVSLVARSARIAPPPK